MVAPGSDHPIVVKLPRDVGARLAAAVRTLNRSPDDVAVEACRRLLATLEARRLDDEYERGYKRLPEDASDAEAMLPHLPLAPEDWT